MQNYHMRQNPAQNNINININNNPPIPMQSPKELSDEEFLIYYKEKYPEEYAKLMQEAYNENTIQESPYENNNKINNQEILDEKIYDMETILKNGEITNSTPLELFLCLTKTYNDFFPFYKRQGVSTISQAISFKNYSVKYSKAHLNINFNKAKEFIEINFRNMRQELLKYDKYQQIIYLMETPLKFEGNDVVLDSQLILKSFINGTSTPNFCKMNKFQTQNLKPSSLYSANLQKFKINKLPRNKIEGFINLKNLYLDSNRIQEIKGLFFPNLEELNLADNYIRKMENLEGCPRLKILNLSYNNIHILENIKNNIYLENINLSNQYIPRFIYFMIRINTIPSPNAIKVLNLENINLYSIPAFFPFLQEINIKNNQIKEMMEILSIVKNSPYLRKINCLGNPFILDNKMNYRNFIIIAGQNLEEVDEKEVKENEKIYVNQLYNRKFGKKKIKIKEKNEEDIGKQNLIVTKVSSKTNNPKYNIPHNNPYDYYNYQ